MNKLVFTLKRDFGSDVRLISNNHKDLQEYLDNNFDWYLKEVKEDTVVIQELPGYSREYATLHWVKHI